MCRRVCGTIGSLGRHESARCGLVGTAEPAGVARRASAPARHPTPRRPTQPIAPGAQGGTMLLIRDIMYCKPGKVRPMVEKFLAMAKLSERSGMPRPRIMTDVSAERYWTVVAEMEAPSLEAFMQMGSDAATAREFERIMQGYHDLVDHGRREIYTIEG